MSDSRPFSQQALASAIATGVVLFGVVWLFLSQFMVNGPAMIIAAAIGFFSMLRLYEWMLRVNADRRIADGKLDDKA